MVIIYSKNDDDDDDDDHDDDDLCALGAVSMVQQSTCFNAIVFYPRNHRLERDCYSGIYLHRLTHQHSPIIDATSSFPATPNC